VAKAVAEDVPEFASDPLVEMYHVVLDVGELLVRATVCIEVTEPAALVAVSVYAVVTVGLTLIEPLAEVDVNVPGVMAIDVAPLVDQLRVLLAPEVIVAGLPAKELIVGLLAAFTVMVCAEVTEPAASVAVSV
jgi:hypothetical protein